VLEGKDQSINKQKIINQSINQLIKKLSIDNYQIINQAHLLLLKYSNLSLLLACAWRSRVADNPPRGHILRLADVAFGAGHPDGVAHIGVAEAQVGANNRDFGATIDWTLLRLKVVDPGQRANGGRPTGEPF
jgi:hypothetical protein